ncbi:mitogen-activated protein kinase 7-like [Triticum urartu]|uniref:mitogen-activated protein kinase 7-like n=1 Tax=Triticum urartu TaxID=4572 RepID=UPI0020446F29|nr:mitogen-activated protein kinase 7-like [Triticum urartu]
MPQRFGRSRVVHSRFFLCSRLAFVQPHPLTASLLHHHSSPFFLPSLPARALSLSHLRSPQVSARLRVSGQQQQLRQFRARRSRALGDVEDDDLPLPHSGVLLCAVERRPWPPDARAPPAKDPRASRPPPRHPHLARDLHQVPSSARATLRAPPRSSAARALRPPRTRSRGEELPTTSLSSPGKPAGRPRLLVTSLLPFFPAGTHHPFLGFCGKPAASCGPCPAVEKANG